MLPVLKTLSSAPQFPRPIFSGWCLLLIGMTLLGSSLASEGAPLKVPAPPALKFYHGVYPGGISGEEDDLTPGDLASYEKAVGRRAAWVYFSNNWYVDHKFPLKTA
ncbi:MAG: hypothetical protein ABI615_03625, partial [Chthoniobacterales bacterium]